MDETIEKEEMGGRERGGWVSREVGLEEELGKKERRGVEEGDPLI